LPKGKKKTAFKYTYVYYYVNGRKHWPKEKINKAKCAKDGEDETVT
jgi:hypothetical protein